MNKLLKKCKNLSEPKKILFGVLFGLGLIFIFLVVFKSYIFAQFILFAVGNGFEIIIGLIIIDVIYNQVKKRKKKK